MEYKISKLTLIKWYRINYKRVCYENYKLKQENKELDYYKQKEKQDFDERDYYEE